MKHVRLPWTQAQASGAWESRSAVRTWPVLPRHAHNVALLHSASLQYSCASSLAGSNLHPSGLIGCLAEGLKQGQLAPSPSASAPTSGMWGSGATQRLQGASIAGSLLHTYMHALPYSLA